MINHQRNEFEIVRHLKGQAVENIRKGIDGERWIYTNRKKTKTRSSVPLLPMAVQIIDKYATNRIYINKGTLLPVPSNQKMNDYLKEIADLCGIDKN